MRQCDIQRSFGEEIAWLAKSAVPTLAVITFFEDRPGWLFEFVDDSDGIYTIVANHLTSHHQLSAQGTDMEALIRDLRARTVQPSATAETPR